MSTQATGSARLRISTRSGAPQTLILEPWANEYPLAAGKAYEVLVEGDLREATEIEVRDDGAERVIVIYAPGAGSMLRIFEDGRELP